MFGYVVIREETKSKVQAIGEEKQEEKTRWLSDRKLAKWTLAITVIIFIDQSVVSRLLDRKSDHKKTEMSTPKQEITLPHNPTISQGKASGSSKTNSSPPPVLKNAEKK